MLADDTEPNGGVDLDLCRRNQNGMVAGIDTAEAPEHEAEAVVRVETQRDVSRRVQLTLQLHGATQGRRRRV